MDIKDVKPTSIRLPKELMDKLYFDAEKNKRSVTKQIEFIIEQYYEMKNMMNQ